MSTIENIELHVRNYRSALKGTLEITINSLTNYYLRINSILHPLASDQNQLDVSSFCYSVLRLPHCIDKTHKVLLGQNLNVFSQSGFESVDSWPKVSAAARRRTFHFHPKKKLLAAFIPSISDVDDIVNTLIAFQIEWNKFHTILHLHFPQKLNLNHPKIQEILEISPKDWQSLTTALGPSWKLRLRRIYRSTLNLRLQQLAGSWIDYNKNIQRWWKNIAINVQDKFHISHQNIYFVSSNTHSLLNLFTGFIAQNEKAIISSLKNSQPDLYHTWQQIQAKEYFLHPNDFLYFACRYMLKNQHCLLRYQKYQQKVGVVTIESQHNLDITTQIFPIKNLTKSKFLDPRLKITKRSAIENSEALIFNIDYPLGFAAYHILKEVLENVNQVKGVYIMGKAAVLNSEIGDIQIPRLVFDEHTQNSYMFKNCFNSFFPFTSNKGSILTNQKAVSVLGTFLENEDLIKKYSENDITIIEMESGPYLGAITEATYNQQIPKSAIVDLNNAPFDIGIINYTSDTPYSQAKNLGTGSLALNGVEPVYLSSLAILQRIINLEESST